MPAGDVSSDRSAIAALVADLDAAASAKDVDRFLSFFVDGPDFAFVFNGTVSVSCADVRAFHLAAWVDVATVSFATELVRLAFPADGVAIVAGLGRSQRALKSGEARAGTYALTLVTVRCPEGWRVLQAHESTPAPAAKTN
jgi:uncharacterized protein (TIGR02246 family)